MSVIVLVEVDTPQNRRAISRTEEQVQEASERTARDLGKRAIQLFRGTVRGWRHKPEFELRVNASGQDIEVLAGTDDEIYGFIDRGTSIRWAVMGPGWRSKTSPGSLRSGPGGGQPLIVGRRAMQARGIAPRPGIKARNFSPKIAEIVDREAEPAFNRNIKRFRS